MIISLSSQEANGGNHASFSNHLRDNIIIPPNSKVALISASLRQYAVDQRLKIPAGTAFYLRFDGQNIQKFVPTAIEQEYSTQEFADAMNALLQANTPYGARILFTLDIHFNLGLKFFCPDDYDDPTDYLTYIHGSKTRTQNWKTLATKTATRNTYAGISVLEPIQFELINQPSYALPSQNSYTPPAGKYFQTQTAGASHAFNRARVFDHRDDVENTIYDSFGIVAGPITAGGLQDARNAFIVGWGQSSFDRINDNYSQAPGDFGAQSANFKEEFQLRGNYTTAISIWNNETNAFDTTTDTYNPGDVIQHFLINTADAPPAPQTSALYNPFWRKLDYYGLVGWWSLNLNNSTAPADREYRTLRIQHESAFNFLQDQCDNPSTGNDFITALGYDNTAKTACNRGIGVYSGWGNTDELTTEAQLPLFWAKVATAATIEGGLPLSFFNNIPKFYRRNPGSGMGGTADWGQQVIFQRPITMRNSSGFSLFLTPNDDALWNNDPNRHIMTVLGGQNSVGTSTGLFEIALNNNEAWDVRFTPYLNTGTPVEFQLLQPGTATRINLVAGGYYGFIATYTMGDTTMKCTCFEMNGAMTGATLYDGFATPPALTFDRLADCEGIAGRNSVSTDSTHFFAGSIGQVRIYNWPHSLTEASLPSGLGVDFVTELGTQFIGQFDSEIVNLEPERTNLFNDQDRKYAVIGNYNMSNNTNETSNYCPVFYNVVDPASTVIYNNNHYPDLVDLYNIPNMRLPIAQNYEDVENLAIEAYTGEGSGIVLLNALQPIFQVVNEDNVNQRAILPYTWYNPGHAHPYAEFEIDVVDSVIEDQVLRICLDNLPVQSWNGKNGNISKCIYQVVSEKLEDANLQYRNVIVNVPQKVWIELNNPGDIVLNSIDVSIRDINDVVEINMVGYTNLMIEIQQD